ncbi:MAG: nucleoside monophosphate kinase [Puniceicoccales bacterium]|jgi:adenylate kinase|nr:nucleoside monophosphate kinase [Puniceicoccales bacterium]
MQKKFFGKVLVLAVAMAVGGGMEMDGVDRSIAGRHAEPWLQHGVSRQAYEDFQEFWDQFASQPHRGQFAIPRMVIWLNGAPGAGKGTNTGYVQDIFAIHAAPLVTSDLLASPAFELAKDAGKLVQDRDVTREVFSHLLHRRHADGVVVDGYPRTTVQAECVKLLHDKIRELKQTSDFRVVIFEVDEAVSVERQLGRGILAKKNNERVERTGQGQVVPLRKTDVDPEAAATRYQIFVQQIEDSLAILQTRFPCHRINAEGSFEAVRQKIYDALRN